MTVESRPATGVRARPDWWLAAGAAVALAFTLLQAAWRSADPDELAVTELSGITAWLFLATLSSATWLADEARSGADRPSALRVVVPLVVATAHALAWWSDLDGLRLVASLAMSAAALGLLVRLALDRPRGLPLDVAGLGSVVAVVVLFGNLALEVLASLADAAPDLLDARGPGLGALAVLIGMTLTESGLRRPPRSVADDRAGTFQMLLFGVGWLTLVGGVGLDDLGLQATSVGLQVIAVVVFLVRLAPDMLPALVRRPSARWSVLALLAAAAYVGLLAQIVAGLADGRYADATSFPRWLETAVDVAAFVGLAGCATLGHAGQWVPADGPAGRSGALDVVAFAAFVVGALGVVAASVADSPIAMRMAWLLGAAAALLVAAGPRAGRRRSTLVAAHRPS